MSAVTWNPLFPDEEIPRILRIVNRCLTRLYKTGQDEMENSLSDRLRSLIQRDPEFRDNVSADVFREVLIYDRTGELIPPLGRGDIFFVHGTGKQKPYPYFVIEAKRLHVTFKKAGWHSLVSEYVTSDQGMLCFIAGRYARDLSSGAMLGYVFDNRLNLARSAIANTIANNTKLLRLKPTSTYAATTLSGVKADETHHGLDGREFTLFHLLSEIDDEV